LILLAIVLGAAIAPEVTGATGVPHPEIKGMLVSPVNIDQSTPTRWLGYFFGVGVIALFGTMLLIGNRKKQEVTSIGKWLILGIGAYFVLYTCMVVSHWSYSDHDGGSFILSMPQPTAWMIFGVWFIPLIITIAYVVYFDRAIISDKEIEEFHTYLEAQKNKSL